MSKIYEYTVIDSKLTSPNTLVVTLYDNERRKPLTFEPGQYAAVSFLNKRNRPTPARCFSISSSPTEQGFLQFGIRVGGGFTKTAQRELAPGSKMIVEGPFGNFTFNATRDRSAMFLAGGIGVTPFLSMIRYATRLQLPNDIMLVYS
ncbi:MAG: ferredoxin--NADP reductase, partial [Candidatus Micrarchaeaceae archaeon]